MARADYWFSFPFRVRYAEIDGQSIVFNGVYLTYFDTAITEYMRALDYDYLGQIERTGTDFHTVKALVEFKAPIRFDEEIDVFVRAARLGRSSLSFALEIHPKDREELRTTGEVVWVNADQAAHTSAPVPPDLVAILEEKEGARLQR